MIDRIAKNTDDTKVTIEAAKVQIWSAKSAMDEHRKVGAFLVETLN